MWQRFTEKARKVIFYAQKEAQNAGDYYLGPEHILLGLLRDPFCVAAKVVRELGVDTDVLYEAVAGSIQKDKPTPIGDLTFTPRGRRIIDLAYDEARNLNNNYIGTEHLMLAIIREDVGITARFLKRAGASLDAARRKVLELQDRPQTEPGAPIKPVKLVDPPDSDTLLSVLHFRQQQMVADHLCLIFLSESRVPAEKSIAQRAVIECGANLVRVEQEVKREIRAEKGPEDIVAGSIGASDLLELALGEANDLNQDINGAHFLLAALKEGSMATARVLKANGIHYEVLRAWLMLPSQA